MHLFFFAFAYHAFVVVARCRTSLAAMSAGPELVALVSLPVTLRVMRPGEMLDDAMFFFFPLALLCRPSLATPSHPLDPSQLAHHPPRMCAQKRRHAKRALRVLATFRKNLTREVLQAAIETHLDADGDAIVAALNVWLDENHIDEDVVAT